MEARPHLWACAFFNSAFVTTKGVFAKWLALIIILIMNDWITHSLVACRVQSKVALIFNMMNVNSDILTRRRISMSYVLRLLVWSLDLGSAMLNSRTKHIATAKLLSRLGDMMRDLILQIGKSLLDKTATIFNVAQLDALFHRCALSWSDALANDSDNVLSVSRLFRAGLLERIALNAWSFDSFKLDLLQLFICQFIIHNLLDGSEIGCSCKLLHILIALCRLIWPGTIHSNLLWCTLDTILCKFWLIPGHPAIIVCFR